MLNIVIFGAPGSGKGTQSDNLVREYGLYHISTGEVLRDHISRETKLGVIANTYISKGNLIPDDLMISVLEDVLDSNPDKTADGVIFDGFPRTIDQAVALKGMLARRGTKVHAVVGLEVDENQLMNRMLLRGKETGRADDNPDTIKQRLEVYRNRTRPLRDYYISEGKYLPINGNNAIDVIFEDIKKALVPIVAK